MIVNHSIPLFPRKRAELNDRKSKHFNLNVHSCGQIDIGKRVYRTRTGIHYVNEAFVHPDFILLARIFMDECRAVHGILMDFRGERHRPHNLGAVSHCNIHDRAHGRINHLRVVGPDFNPEFHFYFFFDFCCQGTRARQATNDM